ncbi:polysaccharide pyruvyl transferase family protein [Allorhizocola rhizosphaerae]|uniref:polysaccharide pyruvyl transferase family protein n=1 Tax=Allorhizocola rhizosphaerae TaxID=1872709 RepID=UPI000E3D527E|nr:polysaccharide pyruvyl transferase family protein [Allorhizocola rhizosphaerae]
MRVGIVGWFGSDNLGDEILLHSLMECVRAAAGQVTFVVFSPNPDRVAELHSVDTAAMPTLRGEGLAQRTKKTMSLMSECDLLICGPGTVFQERSPNLAWPGTLSLFTRILGMAKLAGTPVAAVGVGVREGATAFGRSTLRTFGAASIAIGARDLRSAQHFGAKARVIGDMAYAVPLPEVARPDGPPRFAVSMRPLAPQIQDALVAKLAECARDFGQDGWTGDFLAMAYGRGAHGEDDREIYAEAFRQTLGLAANPLDRPGDFRAGLDDWLRRLGGYRLVLATRLHAALMAVSLGIPTVAIAYERKVHDAFVDIGLEKFVLPPECAAAEMRAAALLAASSEQVFDDARVRIAEQGRVARAFVASMIGGLAR